MRLVKVGCDPEFVVVSPNGTFLNASYFSKDGNRTARFGNDGSIFELRPKESTNVFEVIANIYNLLQFYTEKFPWLKECKFYAGHVAEGHALGGHIHISCNVNYEILGRSTIFMSLLDHVIHDGLMHIVDDKRKRVERRRLGYGKRKSYRSRGVVLEYRTPPSWLSSPTLAFLYLALAKICGLLYLNREPYRVDIGELIELPNNVRDQKLLKAIMQIVGSIKPICQMADMSYCIGLLEKLITHHHIIVPKAVDFKPLWLR